jgi:hypothetical protein
MEPTGPVNPTEPNNEPPKQGFGARLKSLFTAKPTPEPPALTDAREANAKEAEARQQARNDMLTEAEPTNPVLDPEAGRKISSEASGEHPVVDIEAKPTPPADESSTQTAPVGTDSPTDAQPSTDEHTSTDKVA